MVTTKILVNFAKKKVATTTNHRGSKEYQYLIEKGYVEVAIVKSSIIMTSLNPHAVTFVSDEYFNPKDKYPKE